MNDLDLCLEVVQGHVNHCGVSSSKTAWLTTLLQCFDSVGWVVRPVKTVGRITYIVLVQT